MESQLQIFNNCEFGKIGVLMIDGKPYFPATECARALGYKSPRDAIARHCKGDPVVKHDGVSFTVNQHGAETRQTVEKTFISEGNLYRLIVHSNLPAAVRFERWIFDEVLPSIRKKGAYLTDAAIQNLIHNPDFAFQLLQAMIEERKQNGILQAELAIVAPKAKYCDEILKSKNLIQTSVIAKDYGMSAVSFNRLLHAIGIQYRIGETWLLYQAYADKGYAKTVTYKVTPDKTVVHTYWTQKGRMFIYDFLYKLDVLPLIEKSDAHGRK